VTRFSAGLLAIAVAAAVAAGCGGTKTVRQTVATSGETLGTPDEAVFFAHITSLKAAGDHFELQVDPAWFVTGVTASRAKLQDTGESEVPNDYYIRDESHAVLTYLATPATRVTVLDDGLHSIPIEVSELEQILAGGNPEHRRLFDRAHGLGYWVRAHGDTVRSLDQQYQP
jgi:hypothetical protein